jgi:serine phosphatase RsbU (regulator of sigma subunit)
MAYPRFPSKDWSPLTPSGSFLKALSMSLGWRVLLVSLTLVALPLVLFSCLMYVYVAEIKREEIVVELGLLVEEQKMALDQKIASAKRFLQLAVVQAEYIEDKNSLTKIYEEMVVGYPEEVLLFSQNTPQLGWVNLASSEPALLRMKPPCEWKESKEATIDSCTWDNRNMILFSQPLGAECRVSFLLPFQTSMAASKKILPQEEQIHTHFLYRGTFLESNQPAFDQHNTLVIPFEKIMGMMKGQEKLKIPRGIKRIACAIPIDETPYELMIDFPLSIGPVHHHVIHLLLGIVSFLLIIGGGLVYWLTRRMARPLESLARVMHQVEQGNIDIRYQEQPMGFEINRLGEGLNEMLTKMIAFMREHEKQTIEKELLAKELAIGHEIQKQLFPKSVPELPHFDIATAFHPANKVAGDFYDLFLSRGKLLIVMADAAGKGVSACLYSLLLRGMLRSLMESGHSLDEMIPLAHKLLLADASENSMFITAWVGVLDVASMDLVYASLGHFPALLYRDKAVLDLDTNGGALGVETQKSFATKHLRLNPKDLLFLYTDGFVEMFPNSKEIKDRIKTLNDQLSAREVLKQLTPPPPYEDDLTLVAIRIS